MASAQKTERCCEKDKRMAGTGRLSRALIGGEWGQGLRVWKSVICNAREYNEPQFKDQVKQGIRVKE